MKSVEILNAYDTSLYDSELCTLSWQVTLTSLPDKISSQIAEDSLTFNQDHTSIKFVVPSYKDEPVLGLYTYTFKYWLDELPGNYQYQNLSFNVVELPDVPYKVELNEPP